MKIVLSFSGNLPRFLQIPWLCGYNPLTKDIKEKDSFYKYKKDYGEFISHFLYKTERLNEKHLKHKDDKNYNYIFNKYKRFEFITFENSERPFTIYRTIFKSDNTFLNDLFRQFPNLSEKQLLYWNKIINEIYIYTDTAEGIKEKKESDEVFKWLELVYKNCKLSMPDSRFIPSFYDNLKRFKSGVTPLSKKQIDTIMKIKNRYWRQLSKVLVSEIWN